MLNLFILNETYTNGFNYSFLDIISILSILCGIFVITTKNPVVSILFLIGLFFSIASYLMTLGINFIGLSYLLVYVGAVSILFLFILMLINIRISELTTNNNNSILLAAIIGVLLFFPIYTKGTISNLIYYELNKNRLEISYIEFTDDKEVNTTTDMFNNINISLDNLYNSYSQNISFASSRIWDGTLQELSHITSIGSIIYTNYPIWLILTSIVLLLAMVGAIIITIKK